MNTTIDERGKVFRDPIHNLIRIDPDDAVLLDLIDTREFQRLRRIRQLGVGCLTYPGAEHTRFNHSLGVMNFTQRIIQALERRYGPCDAMNVLKTHRRELKAAALLHDIGHGPFSHMAERAFKNRTDHAERTTKLIGSERTEVHQVLRHHGVNISTVRGIIDQASDFPFLYDIVSSQLDADRMDYILRDAHFSGVRYGAYDAEWILNSLCLGLDPDSAADEIGVRHLRLCLDTGRGLHSAEQLIIARYHMSMQVYFHRTTRAWEAHLLILFNEAKRLAGHLPPTTPGVVTHFMESGGEVSEDDFLRLDDAVMSAAFLEWSLSTAPEHKMLAQLADCFLRRKKLLVRRDLTVEESRPDKRILLRSRLEQNIGPSGEAWILDEGYVDLYKFFSARTQVSGHDHEAILLSSGKCDEKAQPFEISSMLFSALGPKSGASAPGKSSLYRLYHLPAVAERAKQAFTETEDLLLNLKT